MDHYNAERPHQSLGMLPPAERFALASGSDLGVVEPQRRGGGAGANARRVPAWGSAPGPACSGGWISADRSDWRGSVIGCRLCWLVSRSRPVVADNLVQIYHHDVLVASHA